MNSLQDLRPFGFCAYDLPLSSLSTLLNTIISSPLLCTIEGFRWHGFLQAADYWNSSAGARSSTPPFPRSLHSTTPAPPSSLHV
ncbi:hypothetical protein BDV38DRAFT_237114 [Aspergillus pseudotamarii]|uniref:Uncharacterized protein n=1 Tax=Aspergillus pseudotamarii TaxID=132259 RepID=A0A5N6T5W0_ASPPS|nr:uncharacterized protein BDV38DRAFT_237114 [Aspergillus pseudotamarii]KAE8141571.1 hypothetical protein BDV38DRAFT_237114 [Aspergillus pseudotamarii]